MLRQAVLSASHSDRLRHLVEVAPVSRGVVARYVPGSRTEDAVQAVRQLQAKGLTISLDHLGEDTRDLGQAHATRDAYLALIRALAEAGLAEGADYSIKLSAVGQALPDNGGKIARDHAAEVCAAAGGTGGTVTLDMEDHTTTDATLSALRDLRRDFPWVGAVLQTYLRRTESDCRDLAHEGSRVRLCKGAYEEPESVAFQGKRSVDLSYVRCLKVLMSGQGYPMVATHDPRLVDIAGALAVRGERAQGTYEYQMLYGIRPQEQLRLVRSGEKVRVYVPYGQEWYGYLMRRLAERPANTAFFLRSLLTKD